MSALLPRPFLDPMLYAASNVVMFRLRESEHISEVSSMTMSAPVASAPMEDEKPRRRTSEI